MRSGHSKRVGTDLIRAYVPDIHGSVTAAELRVQFGAASVKR